MEKIFFLPKTIFMIQDAENHLKKKRFKFEMGKKFMNGYFTKVIID